MKYQQIVRLLTSKKCMNKLDIIKNNFCRVMEIKKLPKNFDKLKMGDISKWDSLSNMNFLMSLEESFSVRLTIDEMTTLKSISKIKKKFLK